MAGTGKITAGTPSPVGHNQYDVTITFEIAFDWGGWNNYGAPYAIWCDGQKATGTATFNISSGGGSWRWGTIASKTFRITMPTSGSAKTINFSASINTGATPSYIEAHGSKSLPARTWQWTVSYDANGGQGVPSSQTKNANQTLRLSSTTPTRAGYVFKNWNTSQNGGGTPYSPGGSYTENAGAKLYAQWTAGQCSITYNANGGSNAPSTQTYSYSDSGTISLSTQRPTRQNYNFLGWSLSNNVSTASFQPGSAWQRNKMGHYTLYAVWELAYAAPRINSLSVERANSYGSITDEGLYAKIYFNWQTEQYAQRIDITIIPMSGNYSQGRDTVYISGYNGTYNKTIPISSSSITSDVECEVKIVVTDSSGSSERRVMLSGTAYIIDVLSSGNGIAFGQASTHPGFEVNMDSKFKKSLKDRFDTPISNGVTPQNTSINPNTTLDHEIVTNVNTPNGQMMYVMTCFYNTKSTTANRMQVAYPYNNSGGTIYSRYYSSGSWSNWKKYLNESSTSDYITEVGNNANGHYRKWSSGRLEMWGNIDTTPGDSSNPNYGYIGVWGTWHAYNKSLQFPINSTTLPTYNIQVRSNAYSVVSPKSSSLTSMDFWSMFSSKPPDNVIYMYKAEGTWK